MCNDCRKDQLTELAKLLANASTGDKQHDQLFHDLGVVVGAIVPIEADEETIVKLLADRSDADHESFYQRVGYMAHALGEIREMLKNVVAIDESVNARAIAAALADLIVAERPTAPEIMVPNNGGRGPRPPVS